VVPPDNQTGLTILEARFVKRGPKLLPTVHEKVGGKFSPGAEAIGAAARGTGANRLFECEIGFFFAGGMGGEVWYQASFQRSFGTNFFSWVEKKELGEGSTIEKKRVCPWFYLRSLLPGDPQLFAAFFWFCTQRFCVSTGN